MLALHDFPKLKGLGKIQTSPGRWKFMGILTLLQTVVTFFCQSFQAFNHFSESICPNLCLACSYVMLSVTDPSLVINSVGLFQRYSSPLCLASPC